MDDNFDTFIEQISNNLEKININNFLEDIKKAKETNEFYELSNQFCDTIIDSKSKILLILSEEKEKIFNNNSQINIKFKNTNNEQNQLINNIKSIINQSKLKLKNLTSNINDLNSTLNLITGNLEKKKYSLATSRVEKLIQLRTTMSTNVKSLESLHLNALKEIKSEQNSNKKIMNSTSIKLRPNRTPSPFTPQRINNKNRFTSRNKKNNIYDKNNKTKRELSTSMLNPKIRGKSINLKEIKNLNTINVDGRSLSKNKTINYEKENEDLKKKLSIQKQLNDRLNKELQKSRRKSHGNITPPKIISNLTKTKKDNEIKNIPLEIKKNIFTFNDKINKISDLMFSLSFSINNLQNKKEISSLFDSDFINIKKYLLQITAEISELKSCLIKISLNNETKKNDNNLKSISFNKFSESLKLEDDNNNFSTNEINNLKKENIDLHSSLDLYKSQIISLNQKLSNEQKSKENMEKSLNDIKFKNEELIEKIYKIEKLNKSTSNLIKDNNEEGDTYLKDISTMSYSEIMNLKEELRNSEKKYLELKGMFDSNIESKNLIENLLKKIMKK